MDEKDRQNLEQEAPEPLTSAEEKTKNSPAAEREDVNGSNRV